MDSNSNVIVVNVVVDHVCEDSECSDGDHEHSGKGESQRWYVRTDKVWSRIIHDSLKGLTCPSKKFFLLSLAVINQA